MNFAIRCSTIARSTGSSLGATCLLGLLSLLAALGCNRQSPAPVAAGKAEGAAQAADAQADSHVRPIDELTLALDAVKQLASPSGAQAAWRARAYLNQWLSRTDFAKVAWTPDPLLKNIASAYQQTPGLNELARRSFSGWPNPQELESQPWLHEQRNDLDYFQQALWLHDIVDRVALPQATPERQDWLAEVEQASGITVAEKLAKADRLFDWTVRNLQLDPLLPAPKPPVATADANEEQRNWASLPAPLRGEPGPGYQNSVRKVLLTGHGDAWERGRVFLLLCRQAGIDAVMLGLHDEATISARAWVAAVLIDKQLYLFDPGLGLAIPGPDLKGIATLEQAVAQPGLLEQLNVTDGPKYPVQQEQLTEIVALIDAAPEALSKRMLLAEQALRGKRHLALTCQPSELKKRLQECRHITGASLWRVPFEAAMFQAVLAARFQQDAGLQWVYSREMSIFLPDRPLAVARNLQLQGMFEDEDQTAGARTMFLAQRTPDRAIDLLQTSNSMRRSIGLAEKLPDDLQQRNAALDRLAHIARRTKQDATYWLALTYLDAGKLSAAREWLADRTLSATPPTPWADGATFNLARIYQQEGNLAKAAELFRAQPESPQHHGNLLRAQWLAAQSAPQVPQSPTGAKP